MILTPTFVSRSQPIIQPVKLAKQSLSKSPLKAQTVKFNLLTQYRLNITLV